MYICRLSCAHYRLQEIEKHLDAWSYEQRLRDATTHSQSVVREYPIALVSPALAAAASVHDGRVHFHPYRKSARDNSRESFLRRLQQVDSAEYGSATMASDGSGNTSTAIDWRRQDPLALFRKQSSSIAQKLTAALTKRAQSSSSSTTGRKAAVVASRSRVPTAVRSVRL